MNTIDKNIPRSHGLIIWAMISIWGLLMFAGIYQLLLYSNTPGKDNNAPLSWPSYQDLNQDKNNFSILMFLHPKCSCSKASLGELSRLLERHPTLRARVIFMVPQDSSEDWQHSDNWILASSMSKVDAVLDQDGRIAKKFNAQTSGYTLLYDKNGQLVFNGGITASRGHVGDNLGSQTISSILDGHSSNLRNTFAFGCSLFKS